MKDKTKIIIAACAAGVLLIGLIASCFMPVTIRVSIPQLENAAETQSRGVEAQTDAAAEPTAATQVNAQQPTETQPAVTETTAVPTSAENAATAAATTQPAATQLSTTQPSTTQPSGSALSKQQIVELYNTAVNKVKKEAATLTRNYKHVSAPEDQLELPGAIQGLGKSAIGMFVKGTDTPESWTSKEDMQIVFPVGNTDYSSHLTADMVETATCEESGGSYKVTLKLYDDKLTSPEKGQGYAGVFNTVTASTFSDISIPTVTFNRVNINGVNGSVACTVDKATTRVTEITFTETDILDLEVKVLVSTLNAKLALATEENYTVTY